MTISISINFSFSTFNFRFEVNDLAVASPATVSRCGMVYMEPVHLGWKPLVANWAMNFADYTKEWAKMLEPAVIEIVEHILPFYREELKEPTGLGTLDNQLVHSFLKFLSTFISSKHGIFSDRETEQGAGSAASGTDSDDIEGEKERQRKKTETHVRMWAAFSCIWTMGGNLHESSRPQFNDFIKPLLKDMCPNIPEDADMYNYLIDDNEVQWITFRSVVPDYVFKADEPFFNILVPTIETTQQRLLLENLMHAGHQVLFAGDTGVGKSVGIQQFLNTCGESYSVTTSNFSAQTSASNVVDIFENSLEKKRKNLLGAPPGTTMLMFIDDINMPAVEVYGAQPPIELLRQVIDAGGFYDRKKLFWKNV